MNTPLSPPPAAERQVRCWCGHESLEDWSPDYWRCPTCQTLVLREMRGEEISRVRDDDQDFYGKNYYLHHVQEDYGLPDLETRARVDLPERCLHWLRTLLKFVPGPGARTLEMGCGHGGFVAMQRWAGLDATGLELSPWLVDRARDWFGVPVLGGRLEDQDLPAGSLDAVVLMDVLEHLPDPRATLGRAVSLLRQPGGFLLIQTPCYPAGVSYEMLLAQNHAFLTQLKPQEHLYLFSQGAVARLCAELGVGQVRFEPAIFAHYDQFAVASAEPLRERPPEERAPMLLAAAPPARWTLAMLDLAGTRDDFAARLAAVAADNADLRGKARTLDEEITRLHGVMGELFPRVDAAENARNLAAAQLTDLRQNFERVEADNAARLQVIERQGAEIARLHAEVDQHLQTAAGFWPRLDAAVNERNLLAAQTEDLRGHFAQSEADRESRREVIERQGEEISRLHAEVDRWLRAASDLGPRLEAAQHESNLRAAQLADLRGHFENSEADRTARLEVIESQGATVGRLQAQLAAQEAERARLTADADRFRAAHSQLQAAYGELQTTHDELQATHDELQATHGELQAAHDELQTAHAGLQNAHAELQASHDEWQTAHGQLWAAHDELQTAHAQMAGAYETLRARKKTLDKHWTTWVLKRLRLWPLG